MVQTEEFSLSLKDCKNYYRFLWTQPNFQKSCKKTICAYSFIMCSLVFLWTVCSFFHQIFRRMQLYNRSFSDIVQLVTIKNFFLYIMMNYGSLFLIIIVCSLILFLHFKYDIFSICSNNLFSIVKDRGNKITIYLTETEIKINYDKAEINYSLEQIQNVYKTDKYIFFFVGKKTGMVVPLSAFNSDEHANAFFTELRNHTTTKN